MGGGGCSGLMVSALDSGSSSPGCPDWEHCIVFLGQTLYYHNASRHPGEHMGSGKFNTGGNPAID